MTTLDKLVAAARNDALDAAISACRDVGDYEAARMISTMRSVVAPPASAYGIDLDALSSIPEQGVGVTGDAKEIADRLRNAAPKMDANWGRLALDGAMMIEYLFGKAALAPSQPAAVGEWPQRWHDVGYLMSIIDSAIEDGFDPDEDGPLLDEIRAEVKAALVDRDRVKL